MSEHNQKKKIKLSKSNRELLQIQNTILYLSELDENRNRRFKASIALDLGLSRISTAIRRELEPLEEVRKKQAEDRKILTEKKDALLKGKKKPAEKKKIEEDHDESVEKLETEWKEELDKESEIETYAIPVRLLASETTTGPGPDVLDQLSEFIDFDAE